MMSGTNLVTHPINIMEDVALHVWNMCAAALATNILMMKTHMESMMLQTILRDDMMQYLCGNKELTQLPRCGLKALTELFRTSGLYPAGADVVLKQFSSLTSGQRWKSQIKDAFLDHPSLIPTWKSIARPSINFSVRMESDDFVLHWSEVQVDFRRKHDATTTSISIASSSSSTASPLSQWWDVDSVTDHWSAKVASTDGSGDVTVRDEVVNCYRSPEGWTVCDNHGTHSRNVHIVTKSDRHYTYQDYSMGGIKQGWLETIGDGIGSLIYRGEDEDRRARGRDMEVIANWMWDATPPLDRDINESWRRMMIDCGPHECDGKGNSTYDRVVHIRSKVQEQQIQENQKLLASAGKISTEDIRSRLQNSNNVAAQIYGINRNIEIKWCVYGLHLVVSVTNTKTGATYQSLGMNLTRYYNPVTGFDSNGASIDVTIDAATDDGVQSIESEIEHLIPLIGAYYSIFDCRNEFVKIQFSTTLLVQLDGRELQCEV